MIELRALAAVVLASGAWLVLAQLPERFELGPWYAVLMVILFVAGLLGSPTWSHSHT